MNENREKSLRWLGILFYIQFFSLLLYGLNVMYSLLQISIQVGGWYTWLQEGVTLATAICLYLLSGRYRLSGMAKILSLICSVIPLFLHAVMQISVGQYLLLNTWLNRGALVLSMVAWFLEYTAHAELVPADARKWQLLLIGCLIISLVSRVAASLLMDTMSQMVQIGTSWVLTVWTLCANLVNVVEKILYLLLLHRVVCALRKE